MNKELQPLFKNEMWDIVPHSPHKKAIDCRCIFKVKYNVRNSVNIYKAQLIAKGYVQMYRVDYKESFVPVAKMTAIWIVIAVVVAIGWKLHHMYMKNVFLRGELEEEIYMIQPPASNLATIQKQSADSRSCYTDISKDYVLGIRRLPNIFTKSAFTR